MSNKLFNAIRIIGDGAAFAPTKQTSFYTNDYNSGTFFLFECNMNTFAYIRDNMIVDLPEKIVISISHLHEDHVGGLGTFLYYLKYVLKFDSKNVFIVTGDVDSMKQYLDLVAYGHGFENIIDEYRDNRGYRIEPFETKHSEGMKCYGFNVRKDGFFKPHFIDFVYTGDTNELDPMTIEYVNGLDGDLVTEVTLMKESPVHLHLDKILSAINVKAFKENRVKFVHYDYPAAKEVVEHAVDKLLADNFRNER